MLHTLDTSDSLVSDHQAFFDGNDVPMKARAFGRNTTFTVDQAFIHLVIQLQAAPTKPFADPGPHERCVLANAPPKIIASAPSRAAM